MRGRLFRRSWLLCAALLCAAGSSHATTYTYSFSGTVDNTSNPAFITIGETFSGSFQYNDLVLDSNPDPNIGEYLGNGTIDIAFSGGFSIDSGYLQIDLVNGSPDSFYLTGYDDVDPLLVVQLQFIDPTGTALTSDSAVELIPGDFATQVAVVVDVNIGENATGAPTVVPEPASGLLLGLGCAGLAVRRRR